MKKKKSLLLTFLLLIGLFSCEKEKSLTLEAPAENSKDASNLKAANSENNDYFPLFQLYLGKSDAQCDAKVNDMFNHFFYGTDNQKIYYNGPGSNESYIWNMGTGNGNNDVRSEGMSYAMMVCVQLDKKTEFDRLWTWVKNHMRQPNGYFAWRVGTNGNVIDANPAPDGEEYFALALYFAQHRWGTFDSDYGISANAILTAMLNNNPPMFGDNDLVNFQPYMGGVNFTDPSYHLPLFYELFADFGPSNQSSRWQDITDASRAFLASVSTKNTRGLTPDYSDFSGNPRAEDGDHQDFRYDAWRTIMNVTMDAMYGHTDDYGKVGWKPIPCYYADNLLAFCDGKGDN